jgi:ribosomal-protein-alanine N-acetyltransferase
MAGPTIRIPDELGDAGVRLRPMRREDIDPWVRAFADEPQLAVMLGAETDPTPGDLKRRLKRWSDRARAGAGAEYVIASPDGDRLLGAVNLFAVDWHSRRGELGIWLERSVRGHGLGQAALSLMLDLMFAHLGLQRAEMTTTPANAPALALADRLGFVREGLLRARDVQRGRRVDAVMLGLLREEWSRGVS